MNVRMHIANQLGRTLHELGQSMTGEEYGIWVAYYTKDIAEND